MKLKYFIYSIIAAAFLSSAIDVDKNIKVGKTAPKVEISDKNKTIDFSSNDKIKIVSFWSTQNPASRISNRNLSQKYKENNDIEFISVCTDEDVSLMNEVVKIDGLISDNCFSLSQVSLNTIKDYNAEKYPKAYVINEEGIITEII